jgi:hypothetical protein
MLDALVLGAGAKGGQFFLMEVSIAPLRWSLETRGADVQIAMDST